MNKWELAQLNVGTLVAPLDSPQLAGFVAELDRINAIADQSPGFVWRLQSPGGMATNLEHDFSNDIIPNMSVWETVEHLHTYVYRTAHAEIMRRRKEWFTLMKELYTVLWWVPQGHRPTLYEAKIKLELLKARGATADAFTFKKAFPNPSEIEQSGPQQFDDHCPAH